MKLKIKKGDSVQVIAGADKGKKGNVLALDKKAMKIMVTGVREQTHFDKQNGIQVKEGFIDFSNVKLVSAAKSKAKTKSKSK